MGEKQLFNILTRIVFKLMSAELGKLKILKEQLQDCLTDEQRLKVLEKEEKICATLKASPKLRGFVNRLALDRAVILHSLIAIDQNHLLSSAQDREDLLEGLLNDLVAVQKFYADRGGIVGYHYGMQLLLHEVQESNEEKREEYHPPPQYDIRSLTEQTCAHILQGIYSLPYIAELYPVGGAAERLHLVDSVTQAALPAAKLLFCGKTLLEGLIADVQAREYLYYKLFSE